MPNVWGFCVSIRCGIENYITYIYICRHLKKTIVIKALQNEIVLSYFIKIDLEPI